MPSSIGVLVAATSESSVRDTWRALRATSDIPFLCVRDDMVNGHDIAHGGYVFLLADTAFAVACNSYGQNTVAAGCDITFIAPVHAGDRLTAEAAERHRAGRSGIYDVSVRRADGTVVAELRGRSRTIAGTLVPQEDEQT